MKGTAKSPASKSSKATTARKNAEAMKAKKKATRMTKVSATPLQTGKKGRSLVSQSKNAKKR